MDQDQYLADEKYGEQVFDNSSIPPPGSVLLEHKEYGKILALFRTDKHGNPKYLYTRIPLEAKSAASQFCPNYFEVDPTPEPTSTAFADLTKIRLENLAKNKPYIVSSNGEYGCCSHVVLIGNGTIEDKDLELLESIRDKVTIVTLGAAQKKIQGDVYFGMDPFVAHEEIVGNYQNTVAHLCNTIWPTIPHNPWKQVTWWGNYWTKDYGIPVYGEGRIVTFSAIIFAGKTLQAKHIYLLGIEHKLIPSHLAWYHWGIWIQAISWWAGYQDITVWSCTPNTTITNGVVLASFNGALTLAEVL